MSPAAPTPAPSINAIATAASTIINDTNNSQAELNYSHVDLKALNDRRAWTLIPAMVVLGVLMVSGIVGNALVCYVFCRKLKSGTQNFLIVCLAVFDLLSCTIGIPSEIADMRYYYMYESEVACKIMRCINTFTAIGSILTLLVIAVDRYRKICKPFSTQMRMRHVRMSLIPILGGAVLFTWPALVVYGIRTTETKVPGLFGKDCSTPDGIGKTVIPLFYNLLLFLCFIILAVTLIILYGFVLRETKRHNRYLKRNSDFNLPSTGSGHYASEESYSGPDDPCPGGCQVAFSSNNSETANGDAGAVDCGSRVTATNTIAVITTATTTTSTPITTTKTNNNNDNIPDSSSDISNDVTSNESSKLTKSVSSEDDKSADSVDVKSTQASKQTCTSCNGSTSQHAHDNHALDTSDLGISSNSTRSTASSTSQANILPKRSSLASSHSHEEPRRRNLSVTIVGNNIPERAQGSVKNRNTRFRSKTTIIAFLVTLVFILSFLPHLSLQVAKLIVKGFDVSLEGSSLVAYNIFLRSYFINSVSNPLIYGSLNVQFNKEVKTIVKSLCRKV